MRRYEATIKLTLYPVREAESVEEFKKNLVEEYNAACSPELFDLYPEDIEIFSEDLHNMYMTAKQVVDTFSKKDPEETVLIYWYEASEYLDEEDGITLDTWKQKASIYRMAYAAEEGDIIKECLYDDS